VFLRSVDVLHKFYRSPTDLDKGYDDAIAWAVRLNYDVLASEGAVKVINLESNMGNQLDQIGVWSVFPISLPLNPEWIFISPSKFAVVGMPIWLNFMACESADSRLASK
jgi:hypothetical protein